MGARARLQSPFRTFITETRSAASMGTAVKGTGIIVRAVVTIVNIEMQRCFML